MKFSFIFVGVLMFLLPFTAWADTYSLLQSTSTLFGFGGGYDGGSGVTAETNPLTGSQSCPVGYTAHVAFQSTAGTMIMYLCYSNNQIGFIASATLVDTGSDASSTASCLGNGYFSEIFGSAITGPNCNIDVVDNPTLDWFMGLLIFLLSAFGIVWFFRRR